MTIRVTELAELDSVAVRDETATLASMIEADSPSIRASAGAFHDLVVYYGAVLATKNQVEQERQRRSGSLAAVLEDPTLADDEAVDRLVSTYRIVRRPGSQARGVVTVVVSSLSATTVGLGTVFTARGRTFVTEDAYTARTTQAAVVSGTDRLLVARDDGHWGFKIPVVAVDDGAGGNLPKGTILDADPAPANFQLAQVVSDFTGGADGEGNEALLARAAVGLAARALCGRLSMRATLADTFDDLVVDDSIIGMFDPEMLRDRHSLLPVSLGGRVDWYVRSAETPIRQESVREATLMGIDELGRGVWQMAFGRDEYPGLYDVAIRPDSDTATGELALVSDTRSADLTLPDDADFVPDIEDATEAVYSRYQAVVVRFLDPDSPVATLTVGASTADYRVVVRSMPRLDELQDHVSSRRVRNVMGDCLVKAPVPCFVTLGFTIRLRAGQEAPDVDTIAEDLASLVNRWGFTGRLPASALTDIVHNHLPDGASLSAIDMLGTIKRPDGVVRRLRSSELLEIPDEPEAMTTPRTVALLLDPADVTISVVVSEPSPV